MSQQWYYSRGGGPQTGPVETDALRSMIVAGQVTSEDLVWSDGMADWQRAADVHTFFAPPAAAPAYGQTGFPPEQQQQAYGAPGVMLNYHTPVGHGRHYAGFWLRFCAVIVDGLVLWIIQAPISLALGIPLWDSNPRVAPGLGVAVLSNIVSIVIHWLYKSLQESSRHQATLGKRAVGIIVTDEMGSRISFARATGRHFAEYLSMLTLCFGYLMVTWTRKKQALHDIVAGTLVVKKPRG